MLLKNKIEMVFLLETKLASINDRLVKQVWWSNSYLFEFVPLNGLSGGILVIWELSKFVVASVSYDQNFLLLRGDMNGLVEFVEFINAGGLVDLPASGKLFTWFRLDHFLVSAEWLDRFEGLEQRNLPCSVYDHDPVRLSCVEVNWGPHLFCFLNVWLEQKAHVKVMEEEWHRISGTGSIVSVVDKL
ncbi:hypothetical protein V6N13_076231 [Hibiscus sabdariffa]